MPEPAIAAAPILDSVVARALEAMFFSAVLDAADAAADAPGHRAAVRFSGARRGELIVSASHATAAALAANLLGGQASAITSAQASSAVAELANIFCGSFLGALDPRGVFAIAPPDVSACAEAGARPDASPLVAVRRAYVVDEGSLVASVALVGDSL